MKEAFYGTLCLFFVVLSFCICFATDAYRKSTTAIHAKIDCGVIELDVPTESTYEPAHYYYKMFYEMEDAEQFESRIRERVLDIRQKREENK